MRKQWLGVCIAAGLLAACSSKNEQTQSYQTPPPAVCTGPVTEISGAEPRYEPLNPTANQDYQRDGTTWKIVQDPANFTQTGIAAIYDAEPNSNQTASGEVFDPTQLTAAHPTLPIPSYARVTNLANGRMLVVRINDRGPYGNDRVISLSRAAADRLNTSNNTKVRIDPIVVSPDGTLSGPGTACTTIAKQTYALPARPDLESASASPVAAQPAGDVRAMSNDALQPAQSDAGTANATPDSTAQNSMMAGGVAAGTVAAAASNPSGVDNAQPAALPADYGQHDSPVTAPGSEQGVIAQSAQPKPVTAAKAPVHANAPVAASGQYVVQVGAVSDSARANVWQQKLSQQFNVPGRVSHNGAIYRVQLGPFASRAQAVALQQRLVQDAQQQSFVTTAQ